METGNQSGKEGDLSQTYKLVQQITDEMDEAEVEKDNLKTERAEDKVNLEGNEASILGKRQRNSAIGTVNADGSLTVDEERAARRAARTSGNLTVFENLCSRCLTMTIMIVRHHVRLLLRKTWLII